MGKNSEKILSRSGQRVTAQRTLLLDILRERGQHVDADELYRQARLKYPQLSLSTVYRNLQLFKKLGLVDEHHFAEEHHHYEVKSLGEHHHLLCLGCGRIVEFDCPLSQQLKQDISQKHDFEVSGVEVRMVGLCPSCRGKQESRQRPK